MLRAVGRKLSYNYLHVDDSFPKKYAQDLLFTCGAQRPDRRTKAPAATGDELEGVEVKGMALQCLLPYNMANTGLGSEPRTSAASCCGKAGDADPHT